MDKFLIKRPRPSVGESSNIPDTDNSRRARVEFNVDDIIHDPGKRKPINSYDPSIRDQVRMEYLLKGPCQPKRHDFPKKQFGEKKRSFKEYWFNEFNWLEYSVSKDSAYCLCCYLFKQGYGLQSGGEAFVSNGFINWKNAKEAFKTHIGASNSFHNMARRKCEDLQNQRQSVAYLLSNQKLEMQESYRIRLTVTLRCVRYLSRLGLAFRGNDETFDSDNKGNFLETIDFATSLNEEFAKHVGSHAPGNNQMTSPDIQKDMLNACASLTTDAIIKDIGDSFYALLVDESRDSSIQEQMIVVLRYVDKDGQVIERFIGIKHVSDTSAKSLKSAVDKLFSEHNLSISKLRGQGYDGAANMSGEFNGLKSIILEENQSAFFVHCFAHQLQLVVVAVSKNNLAVGNFFNYTSIIVNIAAASCKRSDALKHSHHQKTLERLETGEICTGTGQNQQTSLKRPCDTRWGSYHGTIIRLLDMYPAVLDVLETIKLEGSDGAQRSMAGSMILKMEEYEYVFTMHLIKTIMGITNELSQALQRKDQDIANAMSLVKAVKHRLNTLRMNEWDKFLNEVDVFCAKHGIIMPNMEDFVPTRSRLKAGELIITYLHHFCFDVFYAVIDLISIEMNNRFPESNSELLLCISCLDPKNSFEAFDHVKLLRLAELYSSDFSSTDIIILENQIQTYIFDVRNTSDFCDLRDIGGLAKMMVKKGKDRLFPLVYLLIRLALTLPVATATVERVFSAMNIVKTDLRSKMANQFMNDCLVCFTEKKNL
ncbi:uncharacterized protein LOC126686146 isoform X1 [Mercurialis annua]|uniref:uncharacterized protein LOC126686146 isoform X1 n=1 Tax=Mercurialis annua TaxID=3986 RepID=UPI00215E4757|nr:uncharacterized protein LOC126686146 isoform X1 [Mercurialis annua]